MKRSPAITASSRPRFEGDLVGLDTAAAGRWRGRRPGPPPRRGAPGPGRAHRRSAGSPRGPGPFVPRQGSARRRGGPGSAAATAVDALEGGLSPARGARRGRRSGVRPAGVLADRGRGEAAGARRRAPRAGSGLEDPSSPRQAFDPGVGVVRRGVQSRPNPPRQLDVQGGQVDSRRCPRLQ